MNLTLDDRNVGRFLAGWHGERDRCRTDLLYLCRRVLGYRDVSRAVHGPILDSLQKFPGAVEFHRTPADLAAAVGGKVLWEPKCALEQLPTNVGCVEGRQTLILFPRGHLKSTVATIAHTIQWILNYPNVRILLTTATETLVTSFVIQIRDQFRTNEQLRQLFPELCPQSVGGKVGDFGNLSGFMCPARDNGNKKLGPGGKEQTVQAGTVGSAIAGYHGDVLKDDDTVERLNSSSASGIDEVIRHIGAQGDLLEKYNSSDPERPVRGWLDVIGTPYDFSDFYQVVRSSEAERREKGLVPRWNLVIRSAAPNWPAGPYLWPERMGYQALKEIEEDPAKGPAQLASQYLMNPIVAGQGLITDVKQLVWTPRKVMDDLLPRMTLVAALDLAGMDSGAKGADNDYTCLTVGGFANARLYVPWMLYGRPPVEEVIEWIFRAFAKFPQITKLKVEKEAHARVLLPFLKREMSARGVYLPIEAMPRSNQQSKKDKIKGLRPWFQDGQIRLAEDLPYRTAIETEVKGFPKFRHDDFLDTLTDIMHEAKGVSSGVMQDRRESVASVKDPVESILDGFYRQQEFGVGGFDQDTGWA